MSDLIKKHGYCHTISNGFCTAFLYGGPICQGIAVWHTQFNNFYSIFSQSFHHGQCTFQEWKTCCKIHIQYRLLFLLKYII